MLALRGSFPRAGFGLISHYHYHRTMTGDRHRTPYTDDALKVESGTQPEDIHEFVYRRAVNYYEIDGSIIWNFNNHMLDREQLEKQIPNLMYDRYVIPYQASGVWAYMVHILPMWMTEIEILTYSQRKGKYIPYPNYFRHSDPTANSELTDRICDELAKVMDMNTGRKNA